MDNPRYVYSASSRGGGALLLTAVLLLPLTLLAYRLFPESAPSQLWVMVLLLIGVTFVVGGRKLTAPTVCLEITDTALHYVHHAGRYELAWSDIQAIGQAHLQGDDARYIGIRLRHYDAFLTHVPLRLAVRLLIEQRDLLLVGLRRQCPDGTCPSELLVETGDFATAQQTYKGVQAMFAHRMKNLRAIWHYDLFIPIDFIDWQAAKLCLYLNQKRLQHSSLSCSGHE